MRKIDLVQVGYHETELADTVSECGDSSSGNLHVAFDTVLMTTLQFWRAKNVKGCITANQVY